MQSAQTNSLKLLRWMMVASLALPLALFTVAAAISWVSINEAADREIERTLDVVHEHALKVFETIERSLSEICELTRGLSDDDILANQPKLHLRLKQITSSLPQMRSAWIFDASGRTLVNSIVMPAPRLDFSDRDYFKAQAGGGLGVYVGSPVVPRQLYGTPSFGVSRPRTNSDGSFAGVVQASVYPYYFRDFYARIGREPGSFFALIRNDGEVLAHYPQDDGAFQSDDGGTLGKEIVSDPKPRLVTMTSPSDGIGRRLQSARLAQYPVYVTAGLETSAIRARWLSAMAQHLVFGLPATALMFGLLTLAYRRTQHLQWEESRRMEAEEALRHGQRLEALGQLTGGVAHDFNNLLTVIRGSADMLRRADLPEPRRLHYMDTIANTVGRAAKLTAQLLAFARRQALKPEVFDARKTVQSLCEMIATLIGSRIEITTALPSEPCLINADAGQFETAIINMAVNARDAMNGIGRLTISVQRVDELPTTAADQINPHGHIAVSVTDTGTGIRKDIVGRIFEPFFTTKEVGQGTGLGLSQVFGFAKQSGGEVAVVSEEGRGATFTLYLPRSVGKAPAPTLVVDEAIAVEAGGLSVLVVEDNADVGRFAVDALTEHGNSAFLVDNATRALQELVVDAARYDVMLTDVVMPGMSGIELAQEIRRQGLDLPIILASGYSHVLAQQGSFGFELLQKPYSAEQLVKVLHKEVRSHKAKRDQAAITS